MSNKLCVRVERTSLAVPTSSNRSSNNSRFITQRSSSTGASHELNVQVEGPVTATHTRITGGHQLVPASTSVFSSVAGNAFLDNVIMAGRHHTWWNITKLQDKVG